MTTTKEAKKIKLIAKFLDDKSFDPASVKKIDDVIKLPSSAFKFLEENDVKLIEELFSITKVGGFASLDQDNPFKKASKTKQTKEKIKKIKKDDPEFEERLKKAITISLITRRIKHKSISTEKKEQKIIVAGLNNAGKTAILTKFGGKLGIKDLAALRPTKGISRSEIKTADFELNLWDFGGQKGYRDKYLRTPEKYFMGINLIIFVIDIQDTIRYNEAIEYFDKIIEIVMRLEESPYILVFLHKFDPDIREDEEVLLNIELLKDLIKTIFKGKKLDYDIYLSSIYSMIANEPNFSRFIKNIMNETTGYLEPSSGKIEDLGEVVENTLNMVVQLSESMMRQFKEFDLRLQAIESPKRGRPPKSAPPHAPLPAPVYSSAPLPPPPPPSKAMKAIHTRPRGGMSVRSAIVSELKELFAQRRKLNPD